MLSPSDLPPSHLSARIITASRRLPQSGPPPPPSVQQLNTPRLKGLLCNLICIYLRISDIQCEKRLQLLPMSPLGVSEGRMQNRTHNSVIWRS